LKTRTRRDKKTYSTGAAVVALLFFLFLLLLRLLILFPPPKIHQNNPSKRKTPRSEPTTMPATAEEESPWGLTTEVWLSVEEDVEPSLLDVAGDVGIEVDEDGDEMNGVDEGLPRRMRVVYVVEGWVIGRVRIWRRGWYREWVIVVGEHGSEDEHKVDGGEEGGGEMIISRNVFKRWRIAL
jgi:hypothetical protein